MGYLSGVLFNVTTIREHLQGKTPNAGAQPRPKAPGSQGMLPSPSPLRTVQESLPSHGSSPYCLLSMSLVVCMMTPPMPKHAVLLAIVAPCVFGGDLVIGDGIAVVARHLAESTPQVLSLQEALALWCNGFRTCFCADGILDKC